MTLPRTPDPRPADELGENMRILGVMTARFDTARLMGSYISVWTTSSECRNYAAALRWVVARLGEVERERDAERKAWRALVDHYEPYAFNGEPYDNEKGQRLWDALRALGVK